MPIFWSLKDLLKFFTDLLGPSRFLIGPICVWGWLYGPLATLTLQDILYYQDNWIRNAASATLWSLDILWFYEYIKKIHICNFCKVNDTVPVYFYRSLIAGGGYKEMSSVLADQWPIAPSYMSPNAGEGGRGGVAGFQPMSTAVHRSPNM